MSGSRAVGFTLLVALVVVGGPLFICAPLWADAALYDLAARNLLRGGMAYREIFDTNLPGMVWLHAGIRSVLGWSSEALRLCDLAVFSGIVVLLTRWAAPARRVWVAVALLVFYFSLSELSHTQRDTWMLLPALAALALRERRLVGPSVLLALAEGALWGVAFWIKPFVALPALACWATQRLGTRDTLYVSLGGGTVLAAGLLWLLTSGAWPHLVTVFRDWNPEYISYSQSLSRRTRFLGRVFPPWSMLHFIAIPLAVTLLIRTARSQAEGSRLTLPAAFSLTWVIQAAFLQKGYEYSLASATLPALALVAAYPWSLSRRIVFPVVALFCLLVLKNHPLRQPDRLATWVRCWTEGSSPAVRDRLTLVSDRNAPEWTALEKVAEALRPLDLADGELTCYNNSTHSLYLAMGVQPSTPFVHFDTILSSFPSRREELRSLLSKGRQRYVVGDLRAVPLTPEEALSEDPPLPSDVRAAFPWSLPRVFRVGRYVVFEVTEEVGPLVYH